MDDVNYKFVKGQGWVPEKKPATVQDLIKKHYDNLLNEPDDLLLDYAYFNPEGHADEEAEIVTHHGIHGEVFREYRPRRTLRYTLDQFHRAIRINRTEYEISLRYRMRDGRELGYRVELTGNNDRDSRRYQNGLRSLYDLAARGGF